MKYIIKYSILYFIFFTINTIIARDVFNDNNDKNSSNISEHIHYFDKDSIVEIETEAQLKSLLQNSQGPSAISFHMDRCGWCKHMHPIFQSLANNEQFEHITFYSVNGPLVQAHAHTTNILDEPITGYPTIFFINQGKLVDKQIGGTTQDVMVKKLNTLSNTPTIKPEHTHKKKNKHKKPRSQKEIIASIAASSASGG